MTTSNPPASPKIYDSANRGPVALEELRGIFQYRDLIFQLIRRDIVARYKRSILGVGWTMLQPLGMMVILSLVFSQLFHQVQGYPIYVLSGLIAWTFFAQTTNASIQQLVWGGALMRRIYLPRTSFAVSAVGTGLVNLVLSFFLLLFIAPLNGISIGWPVLFIPLSILLLAVFALGVGLFLSALAVYFHDVVEMYQIVLLGWMYLTPVIYPKEIIPPDYARLLLSLNPMYYFIEIFRAPIYRGEIPDPRILATGALISLATLIIGWVVFSLKADRFIYNT